jgi:hypothetical protein
MWSSNWPLNEYATENATRPCGNTHMESDLRRGYWVLARYTVTRKCGVFQGRKHDLA